MLPLLLLLSTNGLVKVSSYNSPELGRIHFRAGDWKLFVVNINTLDNMGPIPAVHGFLDLLSGTEQTIQIGKC